jgi:hypothetical protein
MCGSRHAVHMLTSAPPESPAPSHSPAILVPISAPPSVVESKNDTYDPAGEDDVSSTGQSASCPDSESPSQITQDNDSEGSLGEGIMAAVSIFLLSVSCPSLTFML